MKKTMYFIFIALLLLASCGRKDDLYKANKKILEMKSYIAVAEITVYGNKGVSNYKVKQFFLEPDKVRIETIEPDFLNGKIAVGNNKKWKIYHPLIKQTIETENLKDSEGYVYLGILQKSILCSENTKYNLIKKDGKEYIEIKAVIPEGNDYKKHIVVLLSKDNYLPEILEIYDSNDKLAVKIKYVEFQYNKEIQDSQFTL